MSQPYVPFNLPPRIGLDPTDIDPINSPNLGGRLTDDEFRVQTTTLTNLHDRLNNAMVALNRIDLAVGQGIVAEQLAGYSGEAKKGLAYAHKQETKKERKPHRKERDTARTQIAGVMQDTDMERMLDDFLGPTFAAAQGNEYDTATARQTAAGDAARSRRSADQAYVELRAMWRDHAARPLPPLSSAPQMNNHLPPAFQLNIGQAVRHPIQHRRTARDWRQARRENDADTREWEATVSRPHAERNADRANMQFRDAGPKPSLIHEVAAQRADRTSRRIALIERVHQGWAAELGGAYDTIINNYIDNRDRVADIALEVDVRLGSWPLGTGPADPDFRPETVAEIQQLFVQQAAEIDTLPRRDSGRAEDLRAFNSARYRFEARRIAAGLADGTHGYEAQYTGAPEERAIVVHNGATIEIFYEDGSVGRQTPHGIERFTTDGEQWQRPAMADQTFPEEYDDRATTPTAVLRAYALTAADRFETSLDPRAEVEALAMGYAYAERLDENMVTIAEGYWNAENQLRGIAEQRRQMLAAHPAEIAQLTYDLTSRTPPIDAAELQRAIHDAEARQRTEVDNFDINNQVMIRRLTATRDTNQNLARLTRISMSTNNGWLARLEVTAHPGVRREHGNREAQMLPNGNVLWSNAVMHGIRGTWEINIVGQAELLDYGAGTRTLYDVDGRESGVRPL